MEIGDFLYEDGSVSSEYMQQKKCVGVIFALNDDLAQEDRDEYEAYAISTEDYKEGDTSLFGFCLNNNNNVFYQEEINHDMALDKSGLFYSKSADGNYPALYNPVCIIKVKNCSNWFLPTLGQWRMCLTNLLGVNITQQEPIEWNDKQEIANRLNLSGQYWCASVKEARFTCVVRINDTIPFHVVETKDPKQRYKIRPVIALEKTKR